MTFRSITLAATLLALSATAAWPDVQPERPLRHWKPSVAATPDTNAGPQGAAISTSCSNVRRPDVAVTTSGSNGGCPSAAITTSHSNVSRPGTAITTTAGDCTKAGGAVRADKTGQQVCAKPGGKKSSLDQAFIRR